MYKSYLTYEEFKQEILDMMFFKEKENANSQKKVFENLDTNKTIINSLPYKTAKKLINEESKLLNCDLKKIYEGNEDIQIYKQNLLTAMYEYIKTKDKKTKDNFLDELRSIFMDVIFNYDKTSILKMYSVESFYGLKNYTYTSDNLDNITNFYWDVKGYAFSRIQLNLTTNKDVGVKFLKSKCNFTDDDIRRLTNVSHLERMFLEKKITRNKISSLVSDLSTKLSKYRTEVMQLELSETTRRMKEISNYYYVKKVLFESTKTFVHLMDYDNQFRFTNSTEDSSYLYFYFKKKVENRTPLITSEFIKDFKLQTKYGKNYPKDVIRRFNNIENKLKDNGVRNLTIDQINQLVTPQMILDAVAISELAITSDTIYINDIESAYLSRTDQFTRIDIPLITSVLASDNETSTNEEDIKQNEVFKTINEILDIADEITSKTPINKYQAIQLLNILKKLLEVFISKTSNKIEIDVVKKYQTDLISLCNRTNDLREEVKNNSTIIQGMYEEIKSKITDDTNKELKKLVSFIDTFTDAYVQMTNCEAALTNVMATGVLDKQVKAMYKISNEQQMMFADSFLANKPIAKEEQKQRETNPITILLKQTDFLYMKELDYRNLEATLRMGVGYKPSDMDCKKIWTLIYLILNISARKNEAYDCPKGTTSNTDFMSKVSSLLNAMRLKKWNFEYSDIEKHFSLFYPFAKYKQNPFTSFMKDKGFNESQALAMELRELLESKREDLVDSIKECVYGKNKLYDIMQGLADVAYELSTPITLYSDFSIQEAGENLINSFLNACVSSLEMQTSMLIYDFIFNFSIEINGKTYTLNSLNNMLKMFSLIVEISSNNTISESMIKYDKMAEYTSDYDIYKKIGFYTYNKQWENNFEIDSKLLDKLTGYYLSDNKLLYNIVEYCRHKQPECDPGDIRNLMIRFNRLQRYEWIAIYAVHLLETKDKIFANDILYEFSNTLNVGYLNIQKVVDMLEAESKNTDYNVTYIPPYIEDLGNSIMSNSDDFDRFIQTQKNFFKEFINNMQKNKNILKKNIIDKFSDEKIFDWMMKMFPTYELIAQAFGFASLSGLSNLDNFISKLIDNLNLIIKLTFDKWKQDTVETMKTRQFQLIERERYYYIQSFPVIIDWIIKNLESYINTCSIHTDYSDPVDKDAFEDNLERVDGLIQSSKDQAKELNELSKKLILSLKEEIINMNTFQMNAIRNELLSELVNVYPLDRKRAEKLVDDIFNISSQSTVDLSGIDKDTLEKILVVFEKVISEF